MNTMTTANKPHAKTVKRSEPYTAFRDQVEPSIVKVPEKTSSEWRSLAERVAKHRLYKRNEHIPRLKEAFPACRWMWSVDKLFPYAEGGVLAIDEPRFDAEVKESLQKQAFLKKIGIRMVVLVPREGYDQAMQQLADFDMETKG